MPRKNSLSISAASPIVSSAHLVSPDSAEMSEFEFGLIVAGNAFHRWIIHCMAMCWCCTTSRTVRVTNAWPISVSS